MLTPTIGIDKSLTKVIAFKIVPSPPIEISKSKDLSNSLNELTDSEIKPFNDLKYSNSKNTETFFFSKRDIIFQGRVDTG